MMPTAAILLLLSVMAAIGQPAFILSHTGSFIVHGRGREDPPPIVFDAKRPVLVDVGPELMAVTAERIKGELYRQLHVPNQYRDPIHFILLDRASYDQPIGLVSSKFSDGWRYEVLLPARLETTQLVKSVVQVVLLELANRGATRGAELPSWLVEGLTQEIMSSSVPSYVLNRKVMTREILGYDQISAARSYLKTNACLTFNQLSFTRLDLSSGAGLKLYQHSSHLFVHELLKLRNGPALMSTFITTLPQALNWQTSFLHVYQQHFKRLLDVEKWWELVWLDFKNREAYEIWPIDVSAQKLRLALLTSIEIHATSNSIPERAEVPLATVLEQANLPTQEEILKQKLQQIFFLSFSLAPQVSSLASGYRNAIQEYLQKRNSDIQPSLRNEPEARDRVLARQAAQSFTELDSKVQLLENFHIPQPAVESRGGSQKAPAQARKRR